MTALRPFLTSLFGSFVASLATYLFTRYGIAIDPETQAALVAVGVFVVLTLGGFAKILLSRTVNPSNAARPSIVPTTDPRAPGPTIVPHATIPAGPVVPDA